VRYGCDNIQVASLYTRDLLVWHKIDITDQAWTYFKIFFAEAAKDYVKNIITVDAKYSKSQVEEFVDQNLQQYEFDSAGE